MTTLYITLFTQLIFQLTSSQGGWPHIWNWTHRSLLFNSHPHKEDDGCRSKEEQKAWTFQLTSSQGGWRCLEYKEVRQWFFNSHPHKEDDILCRRFIWCRCFSTHILTRRMTTMNRKIWMNRTVFNSHPHKEDDCSKSSPSRYCIFFNSHPHKEDDGLFPNNFALSESFQLTSSQGGWLECNLQILSNLFFNSHPHKEDDNVRDINNRFAIFSTHILTRRMTDSNRYLRLYVKLFNSHPHKEDDFPSNANQSKGGFSTHILTRRMTFYLQSIFHIGQFSTHILTRRMTFSDRIHLQGHWLFQLTSSQGGWQCQRYQ